MTFRIRVIPPDGEITSKPGYSKLIDAVEEARRIYLNDTKLVVQVLDDEDTLLGEYPRSK